MNGEPMTGDRSLHHISNTRTINNDIIERFHGLPRRVDLKDRERLKGRRSLFNQSPRGK